VSVFGSTKTFTTFMKVTYVAFIISSFFKKVEATLFYLLWSIRKRARCLGFWTVTAYLHGYRAEIKKNSANNEMKRVFHRKLF